MMPRKFSAPSQLCSLGGPMSAPVVLPAGTRKGSLCLAPQQFGYPCTPYGGAPQWANPAGSAPVGLLGALQPTATPISLQQSYHLNSSHKATSGSGSSSSTVGRTTQAS